MQRGGVIEEVRGVQSPQLSERKIDWSRGTLQTSTAQAPWATCTPGLTTQIEALREFIALQGVSKNSTLQEWEKIWSINKRLIDPVAPRHTCEPWQPSNPGNPGLEPPRLQAAPSISTGVPLCALAALRCPPPPLALPGRES